MLPIEIARFRYSLQNPFPPPDRRYQLAKAYLAHGIIPSARRDDEDLFNVYRFLRARAAFRQPKQHITEVLKKYRDLACAFDIHHGKAKVLRPVIEAYLLSKDARAAISASLRLSQETVVSYEKTFFDVAPFMEHPLHVLTRIIGSIGKRGQKKLDEPMLWKLLGYVGGAEALDKLFGNLHGISEPQGEDGITGWISNRTNAVLQIKQLLAVSALKPSNKNHREQLLRLLGQRQRTTNTSADTPRSSVEMHVKAMLDDILWAIGPQDLPEPLQEWQDRAAELRDDEEMKLIAGIEVPGLEERSDVAFPFERIPRQPPQRRPPPET
jgi:hypothetical protein